MQIVEKVPVIGPLYNVSKSTRKVVRSGMNIKKAIDSDDNIITKGVDVVNATTKAAKNLQILSKKIPEAYTDLITMMQGPNLQIISNKVEEHVNRSKDRWALQGLLLELQGGGAYALSKMQRVRRKLKHLGNYPINGVSVVKNKINSIRYYIDSQQDLIFQRKNKLFKFFGDELIELSPKDVKGLVRLDNLRKIFEQSSRKQTVYSDKNGNRYIIEYDKLKGPRLRKIYDKNEFRIILEDNYIEGEWPEITPLRVSLNQEIEKITKAKQEIEETRELLKNNKLNTPQLILKEKRAEELQKLISNGVVDKNVVKKEYIDFLVDKALEAGIEPSMIENVIKGEQLESTELFLVNELMSIDSSNKSEIKKKLNASFKLKGYDLDRVLSDNGININQILDLKEQINVLAKDVYNYNPTTVQEIGLLNTIGAYNLAGGLTEFITSIPLWTWGVGAVSMVVLWLLRRLLKFGFWTSLKLARAIVVFLYNKLKPKPKTEEKKETIVLDSDDDIMEMKAVELSDDEYIEFNEIVDSDGDVFPDPHVRKVSKEKVQKGSVSRGKVLVGREAMEVEAQEPQKITWGNIDVEKGKALIGQTALEIEDNLLPQTITKGEISKGKAISGSLAKVEEIEEEPLFFHLPNKKTESKLESNLIKIMPRGKKEFVYDAAGEWKHKRINERGQPVKHSYNEVRNFWKKCTKDMDQKAQWGAALIANWPRYSQSVDNPRSNIPDWDSQILADGWDIDLDNPPTVERALEPEHIETLALVPFRAARIEEPTLPPSINPSINLSNHLPQMPPPPPPPPQNSSNNSVPLLLPPPIRGERRPEPPHTYSHPAPLSEKESSNFVVDKPDSNVSLGAMGPSGPAYIYKTQKEMKNYRSNALKRSTKRKWSKGIRILKNAGLK